MQYVLRPLRQAAGTQQLRGGGGGGGVGHAHVQALRNLI